MYFILGMLAYIIACIFGEGLNSLLPGMPVSRGVFAGLVVGMAYGIFICLSKEK